MREPEISNLPSSKDSDDFLKIKGIGQSIAQALVQLNITRYEHIAALTPERLAELLHPKLPIVSAQRIAKDDWPGQARTLQESRLADQDAPVHPEPGSPWQAPSQMAHGGWHELADFFVSFGRITGEDGQEIGLKTRVHYSQGDRYMEWGGIATSDMLDWMMDQAGLAPELKQEQGGPVSFESKDELIEPGSANHAGQVSISNIWVSEVEIPTYTGQGEPSRRVQIEADIIIDGSGIQGSAERPVEISVDIYLVNVDTGESLFFETPPTSSGPDHDATSFAFDFAVPPPGRYQLYILGRLLPNKKGSSLIPGPILRVES